MYDMEIAYNAFLSNASKIFFHNKDVSPHHDGRFHCEVSTFTSVRHQVKSLVAFEF